MTGLTRAVARRRLSKTTTIRLLQVTSVSLFLVLWQVGGAAKPFFFSTPSRVIVELRIIVVEDSLFPLLQQTLTALFLGLAIAFVLGVLLGLMMGRYRPVAVMVEPWLAAYYAIPRLAFVPLMVIWFGIDRTFVVATVVVSAAVLMVFATAAGVRQTSLQYLEVSRAFSLPPRVLFTKVLLPGSVPFIATGFFLAVQRGLIAVIVAEFLIGTPGIGLILREARARLVVDKLFAMAIVLMIIGLIILNITKYVERRFSAWRPEAF